MVSSLGRSLKLKLYTFPLYLLSIVILAMLGCTRGWMSGLISFQRSVRTRAAVNAITIGGKVDSSPYGGFAMRTRLFSIKRKDSKPE